MSKIKIGVICGGQSPEHEVSLLSAKNILEGAAQETVCIFIDKKGEWFLEGEKILPCEIKNHIDVAFPMIHGRHGEDGALQGFLSLLGIPFVGAGVLGSSIAMDKDVCKRLCQSAGIPITPFVTVHQGESVHRAVQGLEYPLFVKPANAGSSVGISRVRKEEELAEAAQLAFAYDTKIVVEQGVLGREIECSVLGNESIFVSALGEVIPKDGFYSYEAKYIDSDGAQFVIPASLDAKCAEEIQSIAKQVYKVVGCEGMARVDFFVDRSGSVIFNEINTIPGFTAISLYPRLWRESGMEIDELINHLVELAITKSTTAAATGAGSPL